MTKNPRSQPIGGLFPLDYGLHRLSGCCRTGETTLAALMRSKSAGRVPGTFDAERYAELEEEYGKLPQMGGAPSGVVSNLVRDFMVGVPLWRSPNCQHNIGAAVNVAASAAYALALDVNIYNINSGLAGNALAAERAVAEILADLGDVAREKCHGIFTFGGTGTNLYALKVAISKGHPSAAFDGVPSNIKFLITEDAHFSHAVSADWLGVGTKNLVVIPANGDRRSNLEEAQERARKTLEQGNVLAGIIINGGTTYDHAVDDIAGFVKLRNKLVKEYHLNYVPHIHVDAVIGWAWLMFKGYDFGLNALGLNKGALSKIRIQYERISKVSLADSWGVDFHKGVGGCPIPCSIIMMNNKQDFLLLSKKRDPLMATHQLAGEFSFDSPCDYTLETSRPGGAPIAALAALHSLGQQGYQTYLGRLMELVSLFRGLVRKVPGAVVLNPHSLGYVSMIGVLPPGLDQHLEDAQNLRWIKRTADQRSITYTNDYVKAFFRWDRETRMNQRLETVYSCSSSYVRTDCGMELAALKFYPVSPHLSELHMRKAVKMLEERKGLFDANVWSGRNNDSS